MSLTRRSMVGSAMAGALASGSAIAAGAGPNLAELYAQVRGSGTGRPTYWATRGMKYLQRGATLEPLHAFLMVEAIVFDHQADGGIVSRTLEGGFGLGADGATRALDFLEPISGKRMPVAGIPPMIVTYRSTPDGVLSIPPGNERAGGVVFDGRLRRPSAPKAETWVEETFRTRTTGTPSTVLSEAITYRGFAAGYRERDAMFADATKTVIALRSWPYGGEEPGLTLSAFYEGKKYLALDAMLADIDRKGLDAAYPGFVDRLAAFT